MSINKVILIGHLGDAPDLKYTGLQMAVCTFSLATNENWTDKSGQKQTRTEWHKIVVWGKMAEICSQYLGKGAQVYLEGQLATRSWDDKQGQKRYTTEIIAKSVQFIGNKTTTESKGKQQEETQYQNTSMDFSTDDIPF